jgi:hypothetical protein
MTGIRMAGLLLLLKISRQLDRMERREELSFMKIQDVLDRAGVSLHHLEDTDRELLAEMAAIQEAGGTLTPDQEALANDALARIASLDAADRAAIDAAKAGTTPATGDEPGTPDETPTTDGSDGTAETNGF